MLLRCVILSVLYPSHRRREIDGALSIPTASKCKHVVNSSYKFENHRIRKWFVVNQIQTLWLRAHFHFEQYVLALYCCDILPVHRQCRSNATVPRQYIAAVYCWYTARSSSIPLKTERQPAGLLPVYLLWLRAKICTSTPLFA